MLVAFCVSFVINCVFYLVVYVVIFYCSQIHCCTLPVEMMKKGTFPVHSSTRNTTNGSVSGLFTTVAGSTLSDL